VQHFHRRHQGTTTEDTAAQTQRNGCAANNELSERLNGLSVPPSYAGAPDVDLWDLKVRTAIPRRG
jgi:hypothetical protein